MIFCVHPMVSVSVDFDKFTSPWFIFIQWKRWTKEHIPHVMLYEFKKGNSASESARSIQSVYGNVVVGEWMCRRWFEKFRKGNFSLNDEQRTWWPDVLDDELLKDTVEANPTVTVRQIGPKLNFTHMTIHRHLKRQWKVVKIGKWVPQEMSPRNLQHQIDICTSLHSRQLQAPFLDRLATGDEKWILYNNIKRRYQWFSREEKANHSQEMNSIQWKFCYPFDGICMNSYILSSWKITRLSQLKSTVSSSNDRRRH